MRVWQGGHDERGVARDLSIRRVPLLVDEDERESDPACARVTNALRCRRPGLVLQTLSLRYNTVTGVSPREDHETV